MQRLVCSDSRIEPDADAWNDQHVILVIASPYCLASLAFTLGAYAIDFAVFGPCIS